MIGRWFEWTKDRRTVALVVLALAVAAIPLIFARAATPPGGLYLGATVGTDDQMVYAAWMHQAMRGQFLFDNRFTTIAQPSLTIHAYFWLLGNVARVVGIPLAGALGRFVFGLLFLVGLRRLIGRLGWDASKSTLALGLSIFGGGVAFLVWQNFGREILGSSPDVLKAPMGGLLPIDAWQTEAFVFPSLLENGLFMAALWLITVILNALIDARESAKSVVPGAIAMAALMNIHSYDVLLVGLVAVGWLGAQLRLKDASRAWILRSVAIFTGAVLPAIWFVYVLKNDPVFQARAATETYSANFRQIVFGILPALALGLYGLFPRDRANVWAIRGWIGIVVGIVAMTLASTSAGPGYFMSAPIWLLAFGGAVTGAACLAEKDEPARNLIVAWAIVGLVAMYVPQLFQRKLAEGLIIPWAVLATTGLSRLCEKLASKDMRLLVTAATALLACASSIRWLTRDLELIKANVSTTTVHAVTLAPTEVALLQHLDETKGRVVLIAPPGIRNEFVDEQTKQPIPGAFGRPIVNDLNTIASGLTGVYTVCGHWSETPKYDEARRDVQSLFVKPLDLEAIRKEVARLGATRIVVPKNSPIVRNENIAKVGAIDYENADFTLIKVE